MNKSLDTSLGLCIGIPLLGLAIGMVVTFSSVAIDAFPSGNVGTGLLASAAAIMTIGSIVGVIAVMVDRDDVS